MLITITCLMIIRNTDARDQLTKVLGLFNDNAFPVNVFQVHKDQCQQDVTISLNRMLISLQFSLPTK